MKKLFLFVLFISIIPCVQAYYLHLHVNETGVIKPNLTMISGNFSYYNYHNATNFSTFVISMGNFDYAKPKIFVNESYSGSFTSTERRLPLLIEEKDIDYSALTTVIGRNVTFSNSLNATVMIRGERKFPSNCPLASIDPVQINGNDYFGHSNNTLYIQFTLLPFQTFDVNITCSGLNSISNIVVQDGMFYQINTTAELLTQPRIYAVTDTFFTTEKHLNMNGSMSWDLFFEFHNKDIVPINIYSIDLWATPLGDLVKKIDSRVFERKYIFYDRVLKPNERFLSFENFNYDQTPIIWSNVHFGPIFAKQYNGHYEYHINGFRTCILGVCHGGFFQDPGMPSGGGGGGLIPEDMYKVRVIAPEIDLYPGEIKSFNITFTNNGKLTLNNLSFYSSFSGIWFKPGNLLRLVPGESATIEIMVRAPISIEDLLASISMVSNEFTDTKQIRIKIKKEKAPSDYEPGGLEPKLNIIKRIEQVESDRFNISLIILNTAEEPVSGLVIEDDIKETKLARYDPGVFGISGTNLVLKIDEISPKSISYYNYKTSGVDINRIKKVHVASGHVAMVSTEYIYNPMTKVFGSDFEYTKAEHYLAAAAAFAILALGFLFYFETGGKKDK